MSEADRPSPDELRFMREALAEAQAAAEQGEVPVGAVLVDQSGRVVARGRNRREQTGDPTAHAEVLALRSPLYGGWRRRGTTLYVTLEPCPMCMGALLNARVKRVVFGAFDERAGAAKSLYRLGEDPRLNHRLEVVGGVMEAECGELLRRFFKLRRQGSDEG